MSDVATDVVETGLTESFRVNPVRDQETHLVREREKGICSRSG